MTSAPVPVVPVSSLAEFMAALSADAPRNLEIQASVACPHSITLPPGFSLVGADRDRCILSFPNGDGIGLTRKLREHPKFKGTPILILTTESSEQMKQAGRAAGATGWLVKPFDPNRLIEVIQKVLR